MIQKTILLTFRFIWDVPEPLDSKLVIIKDTYKGKRGGLGFSKDIDFVGTANSESEAAAAAGGGDAYNLAALNDGGGERGVTTKPGQDFSYGEMFQAEEMMKQGK